MLPKSSPDDNGTNALLVMGGVGIGVGAVVMAMQDTIEKVMPLQDAAGEQILGLSGATVLVALLAKRMYRPKELR